MEEGAAETNEVPEKKEPDCRISLIKALQKFVSIYDQRNIEAWIEKLQGIEDGTDETKVRDEYLTYLLIMVQKGILSLPFNKSPPAGQIPPLSAVLTNSVYEDVQKQIQINYCSAQRLLNINAEVYEKPKVRCDPSRFNSEQPRPRKGITASFAVFSNYEG